MKKVGLYTQLFGIAVVAIFTSLGLFEHIRQSLGGARAPSFPTDMIAAGIAAFIVGYVIEISVRRIKR